MDDETAVGEPTLKPDSPQRALLGHIADTLSNLLTTCALLLFIPGAQRLRVTSFQTGLWVIGSLLAAIAYEYSWTRPPALFAPADLPVLLAALLLTPSLAMFVAWRVGQARLALWALLASCSSSVLLGALLCLSWHFGRHLAHYDGFTVHVALLLWWVLALSVAFARLLPGAGPWRWPTALALFSLLALFRWFYPASYWETDYEALDRKARLLASPPADEALMYRQNALLERQLAALLPQRPGVVDLYFVGVAGDAGEPVFQREVQHVAKLMTKRFDSGGRSVLLMNHAATNRRYPLASQVSLAATLNHIGKLADPNEDLVFIYLSSHGSAEHEFVLDYAPLPLQDLRPENLARLIKEAGISYRIIVISACYAGGFIPALRSDRALVIGAADAKSTSFGCGADTHYTWFGEALFAHALTQTRSLEQGFSKAQILIRSWEKRDQLIPSNPQLSVGKDFSKQWQLLENRLPKN